MDTKKLLKHVPWALLGILALFVWRLSHYAGANT